MGIPSILPMRKPRPGTELGTQGSPAKTSSEADAGFRPELLISNGGFTQSPLESCATCFQAWPPGGGDVTSINSGRPRRRRRQSPDEGVRMPALVPPLPTPHSCVSPSLTSEQELLTDQAAAGPGRDWARARAGRALSRPCEPRLAGRNARGAAAVGRGVLAALPAGARGRADGACTHHHISPCGGLAAQISYLKPAQICREQRGSRCVTEASCPS